MRVLICGGGVIGACTAYYLSRRGAEVVVVERCGVAAGASGKSGGFLALDWCDGSPLGPLARRSYALHAELAGTLGEQGGYRRLDALSVVAMPGGRRSKRSRVTDWLGEGAVLQGRLGGGGTTAQIHPMRFTQGMMDAALALGAQLRIGTVQGLVRGPDGAGVAGAIVDGGFLKADAVVIAMGPWSVRACRWLPLPAVHGLKGNSVVFETARPIVTQALFVEAQDEAGRIDTPEVFPRADGTTYVCGLSSEAPLPEDPAAVTPDPGATERLRAITRRFAPALAEAAILSTQACYRPVTRDGLPLLGRVPGVAGAFVATGHSVWGMLNGPASGEALAELILDGEARTVPLQAFDPGRLPAAG